MEDIQIGGSPHQNGNYLFCEPDSEFDSTSTSTANNTNINHTNDYNEEYKYEQDIVDINSNKFILPVNIYDKVSVTNFDFNHWLKTFDLICIKEILVFHGLQAKDKWNKHDFKIVYEHPLIRKDALLLNKIDSMLIVFNSVKKKENSGRRIWQNEEEETNTDNGSNGPSFIDQIVNNHFQDPDSNLIPYNGLTFKLAKLPPMPRTPPMPLPFHCHNCNQI